MWYLFLIRFPPITLIFYEEFERIKEKYYNVTIYFKMGFYGMTISELIKSLVAYLEKESLILKEDEIWATNRILEVLNLSSIEDKVFPT